MVCLSYYFLKLPTVCAEVILVRIAVIPDYAKMEYVPIPVSFLEQAIISIERELALALMFIGGSSARRPLPKWNLPPNEFEVAYSAHLFY